MLPGDAVEALASLAQEHRLAAFRLLVRAGDIEGADDAYERAIGLEADPAVRRFLAARRASLRQS